MSYLPAYLAESPKSPNAGESRFDVGAASSTIVSTPNKGSPPTHFEKLMVCHWLGKKFQKVSRTMRTTISFYNGDITPAN